VHKARPKQEAFVFQKARATTAGAVTPRIHVLRRFVIALQQLDAERWTECAEVDEYWARGQFRNQRMCM
jgi:hypothetical protein